MLKYEGQKNRLNNLLKLSIIIACFEQARQAFVPKLIKRSFAGNQRRKIAAQGRWLLGRAFHAA